MEPALRAKTLPCLANVLKRFRIQQPSHRAASFWYLLSSKVEWKSLKDKISKIKKQEPKVKDKK
jgi:hypothetical protein